MIFSNLILILMRFYKNKKIELQWVLLSANLGNALLIL